MTEHFQRALHEAFNFEEPVIPLDDKSAKTVFNMLKGIDANALFFGLYRGRLTDICQDVIDALNIRISASNKDTEKIRDVVAESRTKQR